jgi:hypothetical protein
MESSNCFYTPKCRASAQTTCSGTLGCNALSTKTFQFFTQLLRFFRGNSPMLRAGTIVTSCDFRQTKSYLQQSAIFALVCAP